MAFTKQNITTLTGDQQEVFSGLAVNGISVGQTVYWSLSRRATNGFGIYTDAALTRLVAQYTGSAFWQEQISGSAIPSSPVVTNDSARYVRLQNIPEVITGSGASKVSNVALTNDSARYVALRDITQEVATGAGSTYASTPVLTNNAARFERITDATGILWTTGSTIGTVNLVSWAMNPSTGRMVVGGTGGFAAYSDNNGGSWTTITGVGTGEIRGIVWCSGLSRFILVGTQSGQSYYSALGATWTLMTGTLGMNCVATDGTSVFSGGTAGQISQTTNGTSWTSIQTVGGAIRSIVWTGSAWVACTDLSGGVNIRFSATGAATWSTPTSGSTTINMDSLAYSPSLGRLVCVGASGTIRTSDDGGANWTARTSGVATQLSDVIRAGGFFIAVGDSGVALKSSDGITWVSTSSGSTNWYTSASFPNGYIWSFGASGANRSTISGFTTTAYASSANRTAGTPSLGSVDTIYTGSYPKTITVASQVSFTLATITAANIGTSLDFDVVTQSTGSLRASVYPSSADRTAGTNLLGSATSTYAATPVRISITSQAAFDLASVTSGLMPLDADIVTVSGSFSSLVYASSADRSAGTNLLGSTVVNYTSTPGPVVISGQVSFNVSAINVTTLSSPVDFSVVLIAVPVSNPVSITAVGGSGVYGSIAIDVTRILFNDSGTITVALGVEGILKYIETQGATNSDLVGHIKVCRPQDPIPSFTDYGLMAYCGGADWLSTRREKIGPILTKVFRINLDLVFNKSLTSREIFSFSKGVSYWEDTISRLFANNTAGGLFRDSLWATNGIMEQNPDSTIIKGVLTVVVDEVLFSNS